MSPDEIYPLAHEPLAASGSRFLPGWAVSKQMMIFPFAVPLDGRGRMLDGVQGVYARALARTLAERLSRPPRLQARVAQLTGEGPLDGEGGMEGHGFIVAAKPWTLEEACHIGLPEGTEYLLHGSAELTDRVRIRILLVDSPQKHLALDHVVLRPRTELFSALDEAAVEVAHALGEEPRREPWPTRDVEAYVAYLRGRDMSAAHEIGVAAPDPRRSFEPYLEALRRDPGFADAQERLLALALSLAARGRGQAEAAREACCNLLALRPAAFQACLALAEIDLLERKPRAAEECIARALSIHADWPPAFARMGTALLLQKRFGEALAWFERALGARRDDPEALQGMGTALAECGRVEEAMGCWDAALHLGVSTANLHENLARASALLGRRAEARRHRTISRRIRGRPRFGLDLLRNAWQWLSHGPGAGR